MGNLDNWNKLKAPPKDALKRIGAGRLSGKTDINPQWRYQAMTEVYGECGVGWKYEIVKLWTEPAPYGQVFAFAQINLFTGIPLNENDPIPGIGGSMLIQREGKGEDERLHANDEAFKMAVTDALSVAMKMLGVAADIYRGRWDGSKYAEPEVETKPKTPLETWTEEFEKKGYKPEALILLLALKKPGVAPIIALQESEIKTSMNKFLSGKAGTMSDLYLNFVKKLDPVDAENLMKKTEDAGIVFQGKDMNYDYPENLLKLAKFYTESHT